VRAIAYVSSATWNLLDEELEQIVIDSRGRNTESGVTGILLYCDGNFMQYLEGPDDAVLATWERIRRNERHYQINELMNQPVAVREFADWTMGFTRPSPNASLDRPAPHWDGPGRRGPGAEMLRVFWRNCRACVA